MSKTKKEQQSLEEILQGIQKDYGEGIISYGVDDRSNLEVIPFSIISMNRISGIGGIARGRITEFHGMDGTFKTTFCLDLVAEEQKVGGTCAFIDAEYSFLPEYAEKLGVHVNKLILIHPASAEEAFAVMEKLIDSKQVTLIVLDSIAALSPSAELNNDFGASNMGVMARLLGQMFRKLTAKIGKSNTALVMINQLRESLGGYVPMKTTPGGNALRFYASMRFEISKSQIKEGNDVKGVNLKVKCVKNKLGQPFLTTEVEAIFGEGIDKEKDLINEAIELGIVKQAGAGWITLAEDVKIQGTDKVKEFLVDNSEFKENLKSQIKAKIGI